MNTLDQYSSNQIKYCRIMCIFFMILVHLPPGFSKISEFPLYFDLIKIFTVDILGRASVTALSFLSGFLLFHSLNNKKFTTFIKGRFETLLLPMIFWNILIIFVGYLIYIATREKIYVIESLQGISTYQFIFDRILALNYGADSDSLNFLRDIFICSLLTPIIIKMSRYFSWYLVIFILAFEHIFTFKPIIMRGMILVFFSMGIIYASNYNTLAKVSDLRGLAWLGFFIVLLVEYDAFLFKIIGDDFIFYELLKRLSVSIIAIDISLILSKTLKFPQLQDYDRAIFFVFLSHNLAFIIFWGVWQLFFGKTINPTYLIFFILTPALWLMISIKIVPLISFLPTRLQKIIHGKVKKA